MTLHTFQRLITELNLSTSSTSSLSITRVEKSTLRHLFSSAFFLLRTHTTSLFRYPSVLIVYPRPSVVNPTTHSTAARTFLRYHVAPSPHPPRTAASTIPHLDPICLRNQPKQNNPAMDCQSPFLIGRRKHVSQIHRFGTR